MNIKFLVRWVFDVPAIIAFGFRVHHAWAVDDDTILSNLSLKERCWTFEKV